MHVIHFDGGDHNALYIDCNLKIELFYIYNKPNSKPTYSTFYLSRTTLWSYPLLHSSLACIYTSSNVQMCKVVVFQECVSLCTAAAHWSNVECGFTCCTIVCINNWRPLSVADAGFCNKTNCWLTWLTWIHNEIF